jgi:hypothetical protein
VDDILYKKNKNPKKILHVFLIGGARTWKMYILLMCVIQTCYNITLKKL